MEFDNSFEVPLPPDQAWAVLTDIHRIAPCMPGAELTDVIDERTYKGRIAVRLGPVALAFAGTVQFEEMDAVARRARVKAQGSDAKGRGGANAAASFHLEPAGDGTKVLVHTNLSLSGSVAQYGRGVGMIQATAAQIMAQFANNLRAQLAAGSADKQVAGAPPASERTDAGNAAGRIAGSPGLSVADASPVNGGTSSAHQIPKPAKPISGLALIGRVLWDSLVRLFPGRPRAP